MGENINESTRARINETIKAALGELRVSPQFTHMMTTVCFEMYRIGRQDGLRYAEACIKQLTSVVLYEKN